jgi:hypothetical protein
MNKSLFLQYCKKIRIWIGTVFFIQVRYSNSGGDDSQRISGKEFNSYI